jgi:hypothetical protein
LQLVLIWYALRHQIFRDLQTYIRLAGVLARECHIRWGRRPPFSVYPSLWLRVGYCNDYISQAAKDTRASQDTLIDIFERIEMFFRRLEIYTELPSTIEMMDTIVHILVEVLCILGVATKEIRQGRMSKYLLYKYKGVDLRMFRKICEVADRKDRDERCAEEA